MAKIFPLTFSAGIQKDGTRLASRAWRKGLWTRFQRGLPKSIGGYTQVISPADGISSLDYLPYNCFMTPSLTAQGRWNLIFATPSSAFKDAGDLSIDAWEIDEVTGVITKYNKILIPTSEPKGKGKNYLEIVGAEKYTSWKFETMSTNNSIFLFAHAIDTISSISGQPPIFPIIYIDVQDIMRDKAQFSYFFNDVEFLPPQADIDVTRDSFEFLREKTKFFYICSGEGMVCLHPYLFIYNESEKGGGGAADLFKGVGVISYTNSIIYFDDTTENYKNIANKVHIASTNIVHGAPLRGGSNSPSGLFWSLDSLIRCYFIDGQEQFAFDLVASNISILSSRCVVEDGSLFYWIGVDRFYVYNGTVQALPNTMNLDYFFKNLDMTKRQKVWGCKIGKYNEIWWHYPNVTLRGYIGECNAVIIYNISEQCWYDSEFPYTKLTPETGLIEGETEITEIGVGRSCGVAVQNFPNPVWIDSYQSYKKNGSDKIIDPSYRIWLHEATADQQVKGFYIRANEYLYTAYSVPSSLESSFVSLADIGPTGEHSGEDQWVKMTRIEPDFNFQASLNFYIKSVKFVNDYTVSEAQANPANFHKPYTAYANDTQGVCQVQVTQTGDDLSLEIDGNLTQDGRTIFPSSRLLHFYFYDAYAAGVKFIVTGLVSGVQTSEDIIGENATNLVVNSYGKPGEVISRNEYDSILTIKYSSFDDDKTMMLSVGSDIPQASNDVKDESNRLSNFYIDMNEAGRFISIKFSQNAYGASFEMGRPLITYESSLIGRSS